MSTASNICPGRNLDPYISVPSDEYLYRIPNPKHMPKYTKAKVPQTQDKHT